MPIQLYSLTFINMRKRSMRRNIRWFQFISSTVAAVTKILIYIRNSNLMHVLYKFIILNFPFGCYHLAVRLSCTAQSPYLDLCNASRMCLLVTDIIKKKQFQSHFRNFFSIFSCTYFTYSIYIYITTISIVYKQLNSFVGMWWWWWWWWGGVAAHLAHLFERHST